MNGMSWFKMVVETRKGLFTMFMCIYKTYPEHCEGIQGNEKQRERERIKPSPE